MKHLYTTLLLLLLCFSSAFGQVETLLVASTRYLYSTDNLEFEPRDSFANTYAQYDDHGLLDTQFTYVFNDTSGVWEEQGRWTYFYDTEEKSTEDLFELLINDNYKNDRRFVYSYNTEGEVSDFVFQKWATDLWEDDYEWTLEYNGNGFETFAEQVTYVDGSPENTQQRLSTYDASNLLMERTFTKWLNDQWVNDRRLIYSHEADGSIIDIVTEKWAADMWNLQKKDDYEYDADGNPVTITTSGYLGGDWIPVSRRLSEFDSEGRILSRLNQAYDLNTMVWVDQTLVYFYYEEFDFTVGLTNLQRMPLQCFPNPSRDGVFSLQIPDLSEKAQLEVYSREGRLLTLRPLQGPVHTIDLSGLPDGLYYLKVATTTQAWTGELQILR